MKSKIEAYFDRLWPVNRSLTSNGVRESFHILSELVDLDISETPTGTTSFDWKVSAEWNVKQAWIKDSAGNTVVDFSNNNLYLLGYSEPFSDNLTYEQFK